MPQVVGAFVATEAATADVPGIGVNDLVSTAKHIRSFLRQRPIWAGGIILHKRTTNC
jgi:hypothetical protein